MVPVAAGAYKGLTIRIGADTTKLSSALRGADSAIYKTQNQLNKLTKALKIDPGNKSIAKLQIGAMAEQATNATRKLTVLKSGMDDLAKVKVLGADGKETDETIGQLAERTGDANLAAKDASDAYTNLNGELESVYKSIKNFDDIDVDLSKATREGNFDEVFKQLKEDYYGVDEQLDKYIDKVEELKPKWTEARAALDNYSNVAKLQDMNVQFASQGAEVQKLVQSYVNLRREQNLNAKSTVGNASDIAQMNSRMALLTAATSTAMERFRALDAAAKIDPSNLDVAKQRAEALAEAIDATQQHASELRSKIDAYESKGIQANAEDAHNLAIELEEAKTKYDGIEDEMAEVSQKMVEAGNSAKVFGVAGTEARDSIEQTATSAEELETEFDQLEQSRKEALDELNTAKARSELANMKAELAADEAQVKSLGNSFSSIKVTSNITAGLKPVNADLKAISAGVDTAKSRFERLNSAAQIKPLSIGIAVDRIRALREVTESTRQKADQLQKKMNAFKAAGIDKLAKTTKDSATAFELAQKKVNDLNQKLAQTKVEEGKDSAAAKELEAALQAAMKAADTAAAVNEFKELEVQMRENETLAKSLKDSMRVSLGGMGAATVQAASQMGQLASQAGQKVISSSDAIDSSYRDLRKTFDATEGDYQKLYDAAMQYSQTHVTSADKMLEMESIAAQLGVGLDGGADAIQHFAEVASSLDIATDIDAETIALQMGQIVNVMHDLDNSKPDTITGFADALVRLGNNMPTQESNIMQITQRLSAIGDVAGFSTPQLMGWAAAVASTGQKSEAAASGIATTITKISTAVSSGGDDLKKWADVAGMSAKQFKKEWEKDPSETLKKVVQGLKDSGDELFATLTGVDVNGVRQTQTLAALAQTIDTVDTAIGMADNAFNGISDTFGKSGDAANEADKKSQGFSGTLAKLKNSADVLAATLGDAMVGPMKTLTDIIQRSTDIINSWSDNTKEKVVLAGGAFAIFSTAWPIISTLGGSLKDFATGALTLAVGGIAKAKTGFGDLHAAISLFSAGEISNLGEAFATADGKIGGFASALGFLSTPLGIVVGTIALVAGAIAFDYITKLQKAKHETEQFQGAIEDINGVTEDLGKSIYATSDYIEDCAEKWSAARVDMDKYHESLKKHTDKQMEARTAMEQTAGSLQRYGKIIDDAIGKGDKYTGNVGELQWAIDKLNESTGSSWTLQDVLTGKYKDQEGAIRNTKEAVDELIDSKMREAKISGLETAISENIAAQEENAVARKNAASAYRDYVDMMWKVEGQKGTQGVWEGGKNGEAFKNHLLQTSEHFRDLALDVKNLRTESINLDEQYEDLSNTLGGLVDLSTIQETSNYGVRESMMRTNSAVEEALRTYMGFTDATIGDGVKRIAEGIRDAGVGMTEFASMSSDTFSQLAQESGGDIDLLVQKIAEWNEQQLEEKYGRIAWGDDTHTWFIDAENRRIEWNGNEWEVKDTSVEVDDSQLDEAESKEQELQDKGNEGVEVDVTTDDSELDETTQKIESQTDETKTVTYDTDDSEIDASQSKVDSIENKEVQVSFTVDDGGISEAKAALDELDNKEIKVSISADTAGASAITDALSGLSGKPVDVKINADTSGADQITTALASLSDKPVNVKINADTSGAQQVTDALANISDKPINVKINADTSGATEIANAIASITANNPIDMQATITAVTNGVAAATTRIQKLNEVSSAMKSQKKTYTAAGNAATSTMPASNINSLNAAAANMNGRSAIYNAYGNAANGNAAGHVWDLVRAISNLNSKSITVTTNYVNNGKPGNSASGTYIPYNKIPKHAAGIFTKPTLTNIGWVGESGAELYSGNSLVPLTNRKYSMPYINDISDAVAKKIGASGDTYNVNIDGARINDDPAIQAAILNLFDVLQRKGAMNVG